MNPIVFVSGLNLTQPLLAFGSGLNIYLHLEAAAGIVSKTATAGLALSLKPPRSVGAKRKAACLLCLRRGG